MTGRAKATQPIQYTLLCCGLFHWAYIPRLWIHMSYWLIFVRIASLAMGRLHDRSNPEDYEPMGTIDRELTKQHTTIHKSWAHFVGCTANPRGFNNQKGVTAPAVPLHCPRTPHNGNWQHEFLYTGVSGISSGISVERLICCLHVELCADSDFPAVYLCWQLTEILRLAHDARERPATGERPLRTGRWGTHLKRHSIDIEITAKSL